MTQLARRRGSIAVLVVLLPFSVGAQVHADDLLKPAVVSAGVEAAASFRDSTTSRHREPFVAGVLGIFAGLGHVYAAEPKRGLAVFGVWFVSAFAGFNSPNRFVSNTGGFMLLATSAFSIVDASRAARRFNKRHSR